MEWMYNQIRYMRQTLTHETQENARILTIDRPDTQLLQILGAAIDLDPTSLWRYYDNTLNIRRFAEMASLRDLFFSRVAVEKMGRAGAAAGAEAEQCPSRSLMEENHETHLRYLSVTEENSIMSPISCYRVSKNSCEYIL
jgi:hypothetical protein